MHWQIHFLSASSASVSNVGSVTYSLYASGSHLENTRLTRNCTKENLMWETGQTNIGKLQEAEREQWGNAEMVTSGCRYYPLVTRSKGSALSEARSLEERPWKAGAQTSEGGCSLRGTGGSEGAQRGSSENVWQSGDWRQLLPPGRERHCWGTAERTIKHIGVGPPSCPCLAVSS